MTNDTKRLLVVNKRWPDDYCRQERREMMLAIAGALAAVLLIVFAVTAFLIWG